jgi:hypothetical protein
VLPALVRGTVDDLLARLDRCVPGRIEGFYVVGSACTGDFRAGRSDVDVVAVVAGEVRSGELRRLRAVHAGRWASSLVRDVGLRSRWPLVCNGIYLRRCDLAKSPLEVTPIAAQVAGRFRIAPREGFDVNPVTWHMLAHHGIAIRGPDRDRLQIRTDDAELRTWTLSNLNGYWRHWAERTQRGRPTATALPRRSSAWGVLGAPRLHYTLATGAIAGKEAAAQYALDVFEPRWHPLIEDALAFWRGAPSRRPYRHHPGRRHRDAGAFVATVIDAASHLVPHSGTAF